MTTPKLAFLGASSAAAIVAAAACTYDYQGALSGGDSQGGASSSTTAMVSASISATTSQASSSGTTSASSTVTTTTTSSTTASSASTGSGGGCGACFPNDPQDPATCRCYHFQQQATAWPDVQCSSSLVHVGISSSAESQFLAPLIKQWAQGNYIWIGLKRETKYMMGLPPNCDASCQWCWRDGEGPCPDKPGSFTSWKAGEPIPSDPDCIATGANGFWVPRLCTDMLPAICEYDPP